MAGWLSRKDNKQITIPAVHTENRQMYVAQQVGDGLRARQVYILSHAEWGYVKFKGSAWLSAEQCQSNTRPC